MENQAKRCSVKRYTVHYLWANGTPCTSSVTASSAFAAGEAICDAFNVKEILEIVEAA